MALITISFPDEEELEAERSFRTYKNYLKSIELAIENCYGPNLFQNLKSALQNKKSLTNPKQAEIDKNKIKKLTSAFQLVFECV